MAKRSRAGFPNRTGQVEDVRAPGPPQKFVYICTLRGMAGFSGWGFDRLPVRPGAGWYVFLCGWGGAALAAKCAVIGPRDPGASLRQGPSRRPEGEGGAAHHGPRGPTLQTPCYHCFTDGGYEAQKIDMPRSYTQKQEKQGFIPRQSSLNLCSTAFH